MKKSTLITKPDIMTCWKCSGKGTIPMLNLMENKIDDGSCPLCKGTGKWIENHYIIIDNKNNIAIDTDNGG